MADCNPRVVTFVVVLVLLNGLPLGSLWIGFVEDFRGKTGGVSTSLQPQGKEPGGRLIQGLIEVNGPFGSFF